MGILSFLSREKLTAVKPVLQAVDVMSDEEFLATYINRDSKTLTGLRHALAGYGNFEREITSLKRCSCSGDKPCVHMYRVALESGRIAQAVKSDEIKKIVHNMSNASYKAFEDEVYGGYHEAKNKKWRDSKTTFEELKGLGLISGEIDNCSWTEFFLDNVAAFIYYVMTDLRCTRGGQVSRYHPETRDVSNEIFLTNNDYSLSRLRHAIWGDWGHVVKIQTWPTVSGSFRRSKYSSSVFRTTLSDCSCDDSTEEGEPIRPCVHMYRLAIETGKFQELVRNKMVEKTVANMSIPLFNSWYEGIIKRGYYNEPHEWGWSAKEFQELKELGIVDGGAKKYRLTELFKRYAPAWVFYTMNDPRAKSS